MNPRIAVVVESIAPADRDAMREAQHRLDALTKPRGSLGRLEELAVQLAGITGRVGQRLPNKAVILMAGDHGVVEEGVSAFPQSVTAQMVTNFLAGGAAINVLANNAGARVTVIDMGVATDLDQHPDLAIRKVGYGTANLGSGPAMTSEDAAQAIETGFACVDEELARDVDLIATGEMGIGNTTPSSAIASVLLGRSPSEVVGVGTGLDEEQLFEKAIVIERAISLNSPNTGDPLEVLAKLGGYEIAGLTGVILRAASARLPILLDGFITSAAALVAARLCPTVIEYLIASHCSVEPGHRLVLEELRLQPLLDLGLRLGEGTGAALAMHLVDGALAVLNEMATFEEAGVANRADHA